MTDAWQVRGARAFHDNGGALPLVLGDFWRWSANNVSGNVLRGWLAEFLVSASLGHLTEPRREWDACDLRLPSGHRLEVKASAYLQSWVQRRATIPTFDVAGKGGWDAERDERLPAGTRFAHAYVFALHAHRIAESADVMDVGQWHFWVLDTRALDKRKSIRLGPLQALAGEPVSFGALGAKLRAVLAAIPVEIAE